MSSANEHEEEGLCLLDVGPVSEERKARSAEERKERSAAEIKEQARLNEELRQLAAELEKPKPRKPPKGKAGANGDGADGANGPPGGAPGGGYAYHELVNRIFARCGEASRDGRLYIPMPNLEVRVTKTRWDNFWLICQKINRDPEHVRAFFVQELGTDITLTARGNLIIMRRYRRQQILTVLRSYRDQFVSCGVCRSSSTALERDHATRLVHLVCADCGSRPTVAPIRSLFRAKQRGERASARRSAT